MVITIVTPASAIRPLEPLLQAYRRKNYSVCFEIAKDFSMLPQFLQRITEKTDATLVIGPRKRSPRTAIRGPVLRCGGGKLIPVGYVPDMGGKALNVFAQTAAHIHQRVPALQPIAILSQWNPQYLRLATRIEDLLRIQKNPVFRWTSDLILREDMVPGLRSGLAAAVYVGHGRPVGWVGYRGTRIHHLAGSVGEPLGALISLCCRTASRKRVGLSFSEAVPMQGIAGSAFGSVTDTLHINNTRWAVRICAALKRGATHIGELIVNALPFDSEVVNEYRLLGDPVAPLFGASQAVQRAQTIKVAH